ncbi:hypothetical protein [Pseudomonas hunanensis]|uniref:hypothetical protein n=1 Tax=Pseudomonas hunanensis TaxID=1247546 RepID=UPI0030DCD5CE
MAIVNGLVNHVWYYAVIAALIGLMLDHFVIGKGIKAAVLFPMVVGVMWLFGDSAQIAQKWTNDVQSPAHQVERPEQSQAQPEPTQ